MRFDENGDLIIAEWGNKKNYIPAKHVGIIRGNLKKGHSWLTASPMYPITRKIAAFILCGGK